MADYEQWCRDWAKERRKLYKALLRAKFANDFDAINKAQEALDEHDRKGRWA